MQVQKLKKKLGQNTAEYIVMLVLVVSGAVGLMSIFSATIRNRIAQVTNVMGGAGEDGELAKLNSEAKKHIEAASAKAAAEVSMGMLENEDAVRYIPAPATPAATPPNP